MAKTGTIDVHTHIVPRSVGDLGMRLGTLPGLVVETETCGCLYRGAKLDRRVDERTWDVARRIVDMDAREVAVQVLSPVPVMFAYDCPLDETSSLLRLTNDGIAEVVRNRPDRFAGLAGIPLQDIDAACSETQRAITALGLHGVEIGTGANGRDLDDEAFYPLWQLLSELDGVVFIHPDERAPGFDRLDVPGLIPAAGYPSETGLAAAKLVTSGIFERFPKLRVVLAHGGGTFPWLLPRLDRVWSRVPAMQARLGAEPSSFASRFWYDTLVYDPANLKLLAERAGADRLMVGTDYPFTIAEDPPGEILTRFSDVSDADRERMRFGNAARLFRR